MKYERREGKQLTYYTHRSFDPKVKNHTRVLGIDPSWNSGFAIVEILDRQQTQYRLLGFGTVDLRTKILTKNGGADLSTVAKIRRMGFVVDELVSIFNPRFAAIETPIIGGSRRGGTFQNVSMIDQGRLYQHLIDKFWGMYLDDSEVNVMTAKSAAIAGLAKWKGTPKKDLVLECVKKRFDLNGPFDKATKDYQFAVGDATSVALGFIRKHKESI